MIAKYWNYSLNLFLGVALLVSAGCIWSAVDDDPENIPTMAVSPTAGASSVDAGGTLDVTLMVANTTNANVTLVEKSTGENESYDSGLNDRGAGQFSGTIDISSLAEAGTYVLEVRLSNWAETFNTHSTRYTYNSAISATNYTVRIYDGVLAIGTPISTADSGLAITEITVN